MRIFQVDAFTDQVFGGNPACVVPLESWLADDILLKVARENAVAETAFFVEGKDSYHIRWFTPDVEMDLCGHATLASAHVLFHHLGFTQQAVRFNSASGVLQVTRRNGMLALDFPSREPSPASLPDAIAQGLALQPLEVLKSRDYVLVYQSEEQVKNMKPDRALFDQINLDPGGIILTAPGNHVDFVSRFFTTQSSIFEDPVTGSAHCSLIPFWGKRLNKTVMEALQVSERLGKLQCEWAGDRVLIEGTAVTYLIGEIFI